MGRSKDLANGETRFANVSGDTFTGLVNITNTYSSDTTEQLRVSDNTGSKLDFFGHANGTKSIQAYADDGSTFYNLNLQPLGGYVTKPNQPAFNIVGNQVAYTSLVTAGGTSNAIPFNTVRGNGTSGFNTSTHVFTAPVAGSYLFTLCTLIQIAQNHESYMYKNGSLYARQYSHGGRATSLSSIIPMAANDFLVFGCDYSVYLHPSTANYTSASITLLG